MSVYEITPRPLPVGILTTHRLVSAVEQLLSRVAARHRARSTRAALRELSDAQLADIGVRRDEIAELVDSFDR